MRIVIVPNQKDTPAGKLADAELHFDARDGLLDGLKLLGFAVWESRYPGQNPLNVTFPARSYSVNGETRTFALLRGVEASSVRSVEAAALAPVREAILAAYAETLKSAQPTVAGATAVARQVWADTKRPPARTTQAAPRGWTSVDTSVPASTPRRAVAPSNGRPPEPPPHTDDDYPF